MLKKKMRILAMASPSFKRLKQEMINTICTHSGTFHADEALAVYMLKILPEYENAHVIRSRKPEDWESSTIVVDVSGRYDGIKFFDHHQRGFDESFDNHSTKLSSAGLIYKHFGRKIIQVVLKDNDMTQNDLDVVYFKIYQQFIEALDANDNGINCYDDNAKPKFFQGCITIPGIISGMNPNWNDDNSAKAFDKQFARASEFMGTAFVDLVKNYGNSWLPAKALVEQAVSDRFKVHSSGQIIELKQFCPWKDHLFNIESELKIRDQVKFVLFPDKGTWRVTTVPIEPGSFRFRQGILEPWRGLRDEELTEKSGIKGCIFVHASGFTGGVNSREGALEMAVRSL